MTYRYVDPGPDNEPVEVVVSRDEILATYYPWWRAEMERLGRWAGDDPETTCVEDWITVHWAEALPEAITHG